MTEVNSAINTGEYLPRSAAGFRKIVKLSGANVGTVFLAANSADWKETNQPQYTEYAKTPPTGPKQRTLHARGTTEIDWSLSGDLTKESSGLLNLLSPEARGLCFDYLEICQGFEGGRFNSINSYSLPWNSVTFSGSANQAISFSLNGKSILRPGTITSPLKNNLDHPIPSWATGNARIKSWTITHSVDQKPNWENNENNLPAYYRPGASSWNIQLTTVRALTEHTRIIFQGGGGFELLEGIVTSRGYQSGGRTSAFEYNLEIQNVRNSVDAFSPSAVSITVPLWPSNLWPNGV